MSIHRRRPPRLRRSWCFLPGAEREILLNARTSGADVLIQELEDFTPPDRRAEARAISAEVLRAWKSAGAVAAVRINVLDGDGLADLAAVMPAAPDVVLLPKVTTAEQVTELERAVCRLESDVGMRLRSTELVPNIESALGLVNAQAILSASPRVTAALAGGEDMAADLGAERTRGGAELAYVRARMLVDSRAAGILPIDMPYTWTDAEGCEADVWAARRLGYTAKAAVSAEHCAIINRVLTPSAEEVAQASRMVEAFETARSRGHARVLLDGSLVELPNYLTAKRLCDRAAAFGVA